MPNEFREQMRDARRQLHDYMSVTAVAWYGEPPEDPEDLIKLTVRVHEKWLALGDLKGTNFNYAEVEAIAPRMIFMVDQIIPDRDLIVSVEIGVAFRVDHTLDADDITITAVVIRLPEDYTTGFPVPGAT